MLVVSREIRGHGDGVRLYPGVHALLHGTVRLGRHLVRHASDHTHKHKSVDVSVPLFPPALVIVQAGEKSSLRLASLSQDCPGHGRQPSVLTQALKLRVGLGKKKKIFQLSVFFKCDRFKIDYRINFFPYLLLYHPKASVSVPPLRVTAHAGRYHMCLILDMMIKAEAVHQNPVDSFNAFEI